MEEGIQLSSRVNLLLPLEVSIQIEKESEKRGIQRTQFIKEAIHEKLKNRDADDLMRELHVLREDTREIKQLTLALLEKLDRIKETQRKNTAGGIMGD